MSQDKKGFTPPPQKEYNEKFDSPIEQAKMHPNLHKALKLALIVDVVCKILLICYAKGWIEVDNGMFDSLVFSFSFILDVVIGIAVAIVRVGKAD